MNEKVSDDIIDSVKRSCSVYPKPDDSEVKIEYIRMRKMIKNINNSASEEKIINYVSKSLDVKNMTENKQWIRYKVDK